MAKVMAALAILVGGLGAVFALLGDFGVAVTDSQQKGIAGVASLVLLLLGVWFHPSIPVGHRADMSAR